MDPIVILVFSIFALVAYLTATVCYFVRRSLTRIFEFCGILLLLVTVILAMIHKFDFGEKATLILLMITLVCVAFLRIMSFVDIKVGNRSKKSSSSSKK